MWTRRRPHPALRQYAGDSRQYADQGEAQDSVDSEGPPAIIAFCCILRHVLGQADKRFLLIRLSDEAERGIKIDFRILHHFADGKVFLDTFDENLNPSAGALRPHQHGYGLHMLGMGEHVHRMEARYPVATL